MAAGLSASARALAARSSSAFLASAGGARAVRAAGADRVRAVITQAITPFHDASGAVSIRNLFRYVVGVKR